MNRLSFRSVAIGNPWARSQQPTLALSLLASLTVGAFSLVIDALRPAGKPDVKPTATFPGPPCRWGRVVCLLLAFLVFASRAEGGESILSETEKQWLVDHPTIRLGVRDLPPLLRQLDGTNRCEGVGMDYVRLLDRRLGIRFTVVHYPSSSHLLDAAKNREVDVLVTIPQTKERSGYLDFSPPYFVPRRSTNLASEAAAGGLADLTNPYGFASRNDWPELGHILAKGLAGVSAAEHDMIRRRWLAPTIWDSISHPRGWATGTVIAGFLIFAIRRYRQQVGRFFMGSIRRNLILVVIVSAVPSLGIILYAGLENRSIRLQAAQHEAGQLTAQSAEWVERLARQIHQSLATLAQVAGLQTADAQQLETNANGLLQSQRMLDVFIFNRRGDVVAAGRPDLVGKINIAQLEIAKTAIQHQGFAVGASVMSATYGQPMIHFALPIGDGPNASDYFLAKAAQLDTWELEFDRTRFPQGTTLAITDRRGLLLYRYPIQASAALGQPIQKFLWDAVSGASVSGVITRPGPEGTPWLLAYRQLSLDKIPSPDLYLLVSVPQARLLAGANRVLGRDLLFLTVATLGAILIAVFLGNRMLLNLLDRIAVAARAVGAGDRSARVGLSAPPKGELGELAITIDVMAANLERDEAERQRAEAQIKKLSSAVEQSPASVVITDPTGAIEYVNPKFTRLTGYTLDEVRGQNFRVLKGGKTSAEEYRRLWESITQGREWRGEFHNRKKSGEMYWELALISPILDAEGRITRFLAVKGPQSRPIRED